MWKLIDIRWILINISDYEELFAINMKPLSQTIIGLFKYIYIKKYILINPASSYTIAIVPSISKNEKS